MAADAYVRDVSTLRIGDAEEAGGKGANLGDPVAADLPVPAAFVLLRSCYLDSMKAGGVADEVNADHRTALTKVGDGPALAELCGRMKELVRKAGIADGVREPLLDGYRRLGPDAVVAVRSSATGEDGRDASFAGMNETITNVCGEQGLLDAVQQCWASLFSRRVITYRASRKFTADPAMAVVVQLMIRSEKAGVAFTADPSTGDEDRVVIEGPYGQGEVVVSGKVEPDTYVVAKDTLEILYTRIGHRDFKIVRGADGHVMRSRSTPNRPTRGCSTTVSCGASPRWRSPPSISTAMRRTPSGRSPMDPSGWSRRARSPRCTTTHHRIPTCWPRGCPPRRESRRARCGCCGRRKRATV
jgi:pyruvate, water dikinase